MDWIKEKLGLAAKPVQQALPSVATDAGVTDALGAPAEPAGQTITGGKRHRKTRRGGKHKGKKHRKQTRKH